MLLGFQSFRELPLNEQENIQKVNLSNWRGFREDVSPSQKKVLMKDLIKKLSF